MADQGYSGWLGGYAKSVAGSVTAFTADILEETRQDSHDVASLLKVSNDKVEQCQTKILSLETEVRKLTAELAEVNDGKEVVEIQLQEVGDRWRSILVEKEEQIKISTEKIRELESERECRRKSESETDQRRSSYKVPLDIDFSDPFLCELEIGRLLTENEKLSSQLEKQSSQVKDGSTNLDDTAEGSARKIADLQAQLRSVYLEHEHEIAIKEREFERRWASSQDNLPQTDDEATELRQVVADLQHQIKREKVYFKQLEDERDSLAESLQNVRLESTQLGEGKLKLEIQLREAVIKSENSEHEVEQLRKLMTDLQKTASTPSPPVSSSSDLEAVISAKSAELAQLQSQLSETTFLLSNRDKEIQQLRVALNTVQSEDFQELRGLCDSLKIQVDGYKESLKDTGHKLLAANTKIETLTSSKVGLEASLTSAETDRDMLEGRVSELQLLLKSRDAFISELQETTSTSRIKIAENTEQLTRFKSEQDILVKNSNQLKAEKLELMVEAKKYKDESESLRSENKKLAAKLEEKLRNSEPPPKEESGTCGATSEDTRRKLDEKSEKLKLLQEKITRLKASQEETEFAHAKREEASKTETAALQSKIAELEEWSADLLLEKQVLQEKVMELESVNPGQDKTADAAQETHDKQEVAVEVAVEEAVKEAVEEAVKEAVKEAVERVKRDAEKDKARLMAEIERLIADSSEIEELYTASVTEKEDLIKRLDAADLGLNSVTSDKQTLQLKLDKVSDNLKKALSRLAVKETKIEELADQVTRLEGQLTSTQEQVQFFRNNQTDEIKAAQLGLLSRVDDEAETTEDNVLTSPEDNLRKQSAEDNLRMQSAQDNLRLEAESDAKYAKLLEECRDKELKIEILKSEVASNTSSSLSDQHLTRLIDQNMQLQKKCSGLEKDNDTLKNQNIEIIHQRDFYQEQASTFHESMETLRAEANKLINDANEREKKTSSEMERLKTQLVSTEQSHTEEYLLANRNEQELREQVNSLRDELLSANSALDTARSGLEEEVSSLTTQLHVTAAQRDSALLKASNLEDQVASSQTALTNLQLVLEQFTEDREGYASEINDRYKRDLEILSNQLSQRDADIKKLQARVSEIQLIEEECRDDSKIKDDRIKVLQKEVSKLDAALKVAQNGLQSVRSTADEDKVERSLMKTFFTQYITAPDSRKPEVLRLMTSILNYSEEELEALRGREQGGKWLSHLLKPTNIPASDLPPGQSFSELFVSFLETEANRGALMGAQRPSSPHRRSPSSSSTPLHRSSPPISGTRHERSNSSASAKSLPAGVTVEFSNPTSSSSTIGVQQNSTPLVVASSLAELLVKSSPHRGPRLDE